MHIYYYIIPTQPSIPMHTYSTCISICEGHFIFVQNEHHMFLILPTPLTINFAIRTIDKKIIRLLISLPDYQVPIYTIYLFYAESITINLHLYMGLYVHIGHAESPASSVCTDFIFSCCKSIHVGILCIYVDVKKNQVSKVGI